MERCRCPINKYRIIDLPEIFCLWTFFSIQCLTVSLASFMLYIVCMMCRHFLKMGHLNVHIVTHTEESRWSSCSYSVISHQPYLSSKIDTEIIRMEVNLDPFLVGFYECSDIFGCQVLSTITRKTQATSFTKYTALNKAWYVVVYKIELPMIRTNRFLSMWCF